MLAQDQLQPQALFPSIGKAQRFQPKTETAPAQSMVATLYAPPEAELPPAQSQALAPETLKKFRRGYGEEAELVATQLKGIVVTSAEGVLRQANLLSKLKERLNGKEWGVWQKEVLGWFGKEVAPYLQIAKTFGKFDPTVFRKVEPFTLLKIRTKRYAPLVERLREELVVTSELIQNLISEVIPTPSRRKKAAPNYDEAVLKQRLNGEDGTFYFTLHANLGDKQGSWLEEKLEDRTLGQVLEYAKSLEKQVEERRDDMRSGIEAQIEQRVRNLVEMAEFALKQEIADLRAQLQSTAKASVVGEKALATSDVTDDEASAEGRAVAASTSVGEFAITTTNNLDDEASTSGIAQAAGTTVGEYDEATLKADHSASDEAGAVAANTTVGEEALATLKADDSASDEGRAVAANTTVGEEALATSDVLDDQGSTEGRAVGANAIVGEKAIASTNVTDDEVSASALIEPISVTVGEQALATSNALEDESSAEPLTEPAALRAQALEPEPTEEASDATPHQSPEQEAMEEPSAHVPVDEVSPLSEASEPSIEPTTVAPQEEEAATFPVEPTSLTDADSDLRAAQEQEITPPWKQLSQLREAEAFLQEIDGHIKKFNLDLATEGLDRIVQNQLRDALKNRQKLRSTKIGQIMAVADASGIIADYEALRNSGRVVLAPSYASALLRQCDSWSEVAMVVGRERDQVLRAVKEWGVEEKQRLVRLLSLHLESESNPLEQIDWIPKNLLSKALSNFTFRLQRIKDSDNLVDDAEMEYLEGCKFVSVQNLGDRHEHWVFEFKEKNIPVIGRDRIAIEKF